MLDDIKRALEAIGLKFGESQISCLTFEIKGRPLIKKNSKNIFFNKKTGRRIIGANKCYAEHSGEQLEQLLQQKMKYSDRVQFPLPGNVIVMSEFHYDNNRMADVSNLLESVHDLMQESAILGNDKNISTILCPIRVLNSDFTGTRIKVFWSKDIKLVAGELRPKEKKNKKEKNNVQM